MSESNNGTEKVPNLALQEERLSRGWTQQELANRIGTTVVNVSRWERGATYPKHYFRQQLCQIFEKDARELGLLPMKQASHSKTTLISEEGAPDPYEKELVPTTKQMTPLSLRQHFLGRRRMVVTITSIALATLVTGGGLLIYTHQQPLPPGAVIGKDTFQRPNQMYWGTASDGQQWAEDANTSTNFSIVNHAAWIAAVGDTDPPYNAPLGPKASNAEVLFTGSMSDFDNSNLGTVLRWTGTNNWYKAYIDGTNLVIQRNVNKITKHLKDYPFAAATGTSYTIRFRAVGTSLMAKVWATASREPSKWMAIASDHSFTAGFCGLRIQVRSAATATVTSFLATAV